jgi:hypothetical protein
MGHAKRHDMLGYQLNLNSVERLVALRRGHEGRALTVR